MLTPQVNPVKTNLEINAGNEALFKIWEERRITALVNFISSHVKDGSIHLSLETNGEELHLTKISPHVYHDLSKLLFWDMTQVRFTAEGREIIIRDPKKKITRFFE